MFLQPSLDDPARDPQNAKEREKKDNKVHVKKPLRGCLSRKQFINNKKRFDRWKPRMVLNAPLKPQSTRLVLISDFIWWKICFIYALLLQAQLGTKTSQG